MKRSVIFKNLLDMCNTDIHEIRKKFKDNYFYFDDNITKIKKNQKLGNQR